MSNTITTQDIASASTTGQDGQPIITGTPTAGSSVEAYVTGSGEVAVVLSGTWTGTVAFESTSDGGITYNPVDAVVKAEDTVIQQATVNGTFLIAAAANQKIRARATAAMTGTVNVAITGQVTTDVQHVIITGPLEHRVIKQTNPTVTAGAYSANNVVGGIQHLIGAVRGGGYKGVLDSVSVIDAAAQGAQLSLFFFKATPVGGTYADHGALVLAAADLPNFLGKVDLAAASYDPMGTAAKGVSATNIGLELQGDSAGDVWVIATTTGTPTLTALCLTFNYGIKQA